MPGGGLDPSGSRWVAARENFFLSVRILSGVFRAKLLAALEDAVVAGEIEPSVGKSADAATLLRRAASKKWVVYCKRPFAGPKQVFDYLGRYTHRIAISNERFTAIDGDDVTFSYKDRTDGNRSKLMTLPGETFLRRFLLHVLPKGFVRIRHYGLLANSVRKERVAICRELLDVRAEEVAPTPHESWEEILFRLTGKDVTACPQCGGRLLVTRRSDPTVSPRRAFLTGAMHEALPP